MTIDSWQAATALAPDLSGPSDPDAASPDHDTLDPGVDLTAAPVTAIGSDPAAASRTDATPVAAGDAATAEAVRLVFRDDQPYSLILAPDWRSRVPAVALGLTLTDQLGRHHTDALAAAEPNESRMLGSSRMPVAVAREMQLRLAQAQDDVLAQLPTIARAPGETVTSTHHRVTVTVAAGRVAIIAVDPDWAETATSMAIIETVGDALGQAQSLIDGDRDDLLGVAQRELADISIALDDWERG